MMSSTIQNISVHGGTGGPGGPGGNAGTGGGGGQGEGPHVTMVSESGVVNHMTFHNASVAFKDEVKTKNRKMCPLPVPSFTGRQEILDEIHQYFVQDLGSRKVFVLHGLGGSGKSQLAFKFVQQAQTSKRFSETYFVDATSEQTAESDLKLLPPATSEETAQEGLHWLSSQQTEWLLVLDNADDPKLDISKFFPPSTSGNILITTRNPELCILGADYKVSDMTLDDAKNLLLKLAEKKAIGDDKEQVAITIVKELHCFALAVTQAGGYIHACSSLNKYLELYKSSRDNLLQRAEVQGQGQYGLAVYATWNLSYQKLSTGSRTFLHICSQLHHQNIREEMFQKAALSENKLEKSELQAIVNEMLTAIGGANQNWNSFIFLEKARELQSYSLIGQNIADASYNVHPLIQYWSGTTINKGDMSKIVFAMIGLSVLWRFKLEDYTYRHSLIYHITQLFGRCKCDLDTYVADRVALVLSEAGHYEKAEVLRVAIVERRKEELGNEHPDTLMSMASLAATYSELGRWSDAESLEVAVLEAQKRVLGNEHPDTLSAMASLAATYSELGRWSDAESLEVAVLEARKPVLGNEHPGTLTAMANLAATYWRQGRWSDAESLGVAVLEARKRVLGNEHPGTLKAMANLAATYCQQGRWSDAASLGVAVLEARKRVLGNEHPGTLKAMESLAHIYWEQGRWSDVESLEVAIVKARVGNEDHEHASPKSAPTSLADLQAHFSIPASDTVMPAHRHKQRAKFSISHLFKRLHKFGS
ncbi:FabD/lysophospholipase-like protein [Favolaschia claudopus]|uniref:FabD/lysophospholipase-like protein n=1 Tax=Favolaschia claudopus TaxID=2862362 RepID=A0AAW0DLQ5_9AGAR